MESQTYCLFSLDNLKCLDVNSLQSGVNQNFVDRLANAQDILKKLEKSLEKSNKYELQIIKCKTCNTHSHVGNDWWADELSDNDDDKSSRTGSEDSTRNRGGEITESWSTMVIICLQHKYEELSKRYNSLLEAYDKRREAISIRDTVISKMRRRLTRAYSKLINSHKTLLAVGKKYLALKSKMNEQKTRHEEKVRKFRYKLNETMENAEQARIEFDEQLIECLAEERDTATAVLLYEIKKCNQLYLENLRLKKQIKE